MSFSVRSLLPLVYPYRDDLIEGRVISAIEEAARYVCNFTQLATEVHAPAPVLNGTSMSVVTPLLGNELNRVVEVRVADVPGAATYLGQWNPATNTPSLTGGGKSGGTVAVQYGFYVATAAAVVTSIDGITNISIGDVLYNAGSNWVQIFIENFITLTELNKKSVNRNINQAQQVGGLIPSSWSQDERGIYWYGCPGCDMAVEITLSYTPVGGIDMIPLLLEFRDCIVDGALAAVYALPGQYQDKQMAAIKRKDYGRHLDNYRSQAVLGYGGDMWDQVPNFAGKNSTSSPFASSSWYM